MSTKRVSLGFAMICLDYRIYELSGLCMLHEGGVWYGRDQDAYQQPRLLCKRAV